MPLIIDGYNLLHASGVFPKDEGPATFERARYALLDFLTGVLSAAQREQTTIVFDAAQAPPGLPAEVKHEGITVRYARGYADADTLIEEMIEKHASPRTLTVVSSDHRIQRAARRRRANPVDSEIWRDQVWRQAEESGAGEPVLTKPGSGLEKTDIAHWMTEFGKIDVEDIEQQLDKESSTDIESDAPSPPDAPAQSNDEDQESHFDNPFPPGYGEDLLEEKQPTDDIFPPGFGEGLFDEEE